MIYLSDSDFTLHHGDVLDVLREMPDASVDCVITSPPYWGLRDYGPEGQLGLEPTPEQYVERMTAVFREVRRVLAAHGTCWLNMGDSYNANTGRGFDTNLAWGKPKDLVGAPWRLAFALQADGWYLRSDIVWSKPNPMPESVTDRPTKAHEYVFLLTKAPRYFFDQEAVRESGTGRTTSGILNGKPNPAAALGQGDTRHSIPWENAEGGRNIRTVWEIATQPYPEAHFATFPEELVRRCLLAGCPEGGIVLDPFMGSGTTALVARKHGRRTVGIELNEDYCKLAAHRTRQLSLLGAA